MTSAAGILASLRIRNFRLFATGQVASVAGTWMMVVAQDWLVLEMTGDSGTALGIVTALQFTPILLFTLYGGRLADRYDKRALLTAGNSAACVLALALAVLVLTDAVRLWWLYVFAFALGLVNAVEVPARMSFVSACSRRAADASKSLVRTSSSRPSTKALSGRTGGSSITATIGTSASATDLAVRWSSSMCRRVGSSY
ncbi:MFS transporter [Streptomyces sp. PSKA30]|uniref:MFS transporter n=1 Tax=Streptomyces sp. PSKA30 TaxID=2874597 RepID=UPI0035AE926E